MGEDHAPPPAGMAVRRHRLAAGLTQHELALRAGVSVRGLRDLEHGRIRQPRATSLRRLADALALSPTQRQTLLATILDTTHPGRRQLHIGVLGPMLVSHAEMPVALPSQRQRALLGLLALHQAQVVPITEIIDVLWGEDPPRTTRNLVSMYASQLRTLLGTAGSSLRPTPGGYALDVGDQQLDLAQFDHLVQQAQAEQTADRPEQAANLYARALEHWRGPILADAGDRLRHHPIATAASQRRTAATVAYADIAVAIGASTQLIATLRSLSREEPLHEAVHGRLMLALAATGERAHALQVFAELRARLAEELGVEPGPDVQAAHLRILRGQVPDTNHTATHSEDSTAVQAPGPVVTRARPAQLPMDVAGFAGREAALGWLTALLDEESAQTTVVITAIGGTAGVGKTALSVHWAHQVRDRFPDGQLYVNLRGFDPGKQVVEPAEVIRGLLNALRVDPQRIPATLDAQTALYRSLLAGRRLLIVLDNAHDSDQVRHLLPGTPGCFVLVTSRNQLTGLVAAVGAHSLTLDLLSADEADQFLAHRLGTPRVKAEPHAVQEIIAACARLPLALAIVAARAVTNPRLTLESLAAQLRDACQLDALTSDDPATDVRAVFSWSYHSLSPHAARLFRLLGLHPGPDIAIAAAASLAGLPPAQVRPLLAELTHANLLAEHTHGRYTFHDLLRAYTRELTEAHDSATDRHAATLRMLDHYLHSAVDADRLLDPHRPPLPLAPVQPGVTVEHPADQRAAIAWFNDERRALIAVTSHAARHGQENHCWQLAWTLETSQDRTGCWRDLATTLQTALEAVRRLGDGAGEARIHRGLARAYVRVNRLEDALDHLQRAFPLYRDHGDRIGEASTHRNISYVYQQQARYHDALAHEQQALALFAATGDLTGQGRSLNAMGWIHAMLGECERAIVYCERSLRLFEPTNRHAQAGSWDSLGLAYLKLGRHREAITCYERALGLYRETGDRPYEADELHSLGDCHRAAGDADDARKAWQQALNIFEDLDHPDAEQVRAKLSTVTTC